MFERLDERSIGDCRHMLCGSVGVQDRLVPVHPGALQHRGSRLRHMHGVHWMRMVRQHGEMPQRNNHWRLPARMRHPMVLHRRHVRGTQRSVLRVRHLRRLQRRRLCGQLRSDSSSAHACLIAPARSTPLRRQRSWLSLLCMCVCLPGWCASTGLCRTGSATGPAASNCSAAAWTFQSCPCSQWTDGGCQTCSSNSGCGWCGADPDSGACLSGYDSAQASGCNSDWTFGSGQWQASTIEGRPSSQQTARKAPN